MCVCGHKNEHFEQNRPAYELYLQCMSQKWSFYIPHERERTSRSVEMQTFCSVETIIFSIGDLY